MNQRYPNQDENDLLSENDAQIADAMRAAGSAKLEELTGQTYDSIDARQQILLLESAALNISGLHMHQLKSVGCDHMQAWDVACAVRDHITRVAAKNMLEFGAGGDPSNEP